MLPDITASRFNDRLESLKWENMDRHDTAHGRLVGDLKSELGVNSRQAQDIVTLLHKTGGNLSGHKSFLKMLLKNATVSLDEAIQIVSRLADENNRQKAIADSRYESGLETIAGEYGRTASGLARRLKAGLPVDQARALAKDNNVIDDLICIHDKRGPDNTPATRYMDVIHAPYKDGKITVPGIDGQSIVLDASSAAIASGDFDTKWSAIVTPLRKAAEAYVANDAMEILTGRGSAESPAAGFLRGLAEDRYIRPIRDELNTAAQRKNAADQALRYSRA